jgi:Uma2 family endonuclease
MSTAVRAGKQQGELLIGPEHAGIRMTPEEFDDLPEENWEEGHRYELIDGVLVVSPIPLDAQVGPNEMLGYWLNDYKFRHPQGAILDATLPERYVRTRRSRRLADRLIWAGLGRTPNTRKDVPTIAVEFLSAGRRNWLRDFVQKCAEYLAVGIQEYWIVNRFDRTMTVYRKSGKGKRETVIPEHAVYRTPLLPGFELNVAKLLAVADAWAEKE